MCPDRVAPLPMAHSRSAHDLTWTRPFSLGPTPALSRADAREAGIALSTLLGPRYHKVIYDRYVVASEPITTRLRAEAAVLASAPDTYVSHFTAAKLWGGIVPHVPDVHISGPDQTHRCRRGEVKAHTSDGKPLPIRHLGLPMSTPAQTFLDLAGVGLTWWIWSSSGTAWSRPAGSARSSSFRLPPMQPAEGRSWHADPRATYARVSTRRWSPGCGC